MQTLIFCHIILATFLTVASCNNSSSVPNRSDTIPGVVQPHIRDSEAVKLVPLGPDSNAVNTDSSQISR